jgi:hypothetical protein
VLPRGGLTLTLLVFFGSGTYDENAAATADDLAVFTNLLNRSTDFHGLYLKTVLRLFIAVRDASAAEVIRRQFHGDFVAGQDFDKMHTHFARNVTEDFVAVFEYNAKRCIRKALLDHAVNLDGLFF